MLSDELLERAGERALLGRAMDEVRAGRGRLLLLEGEAGIGKTALLELAMRLAAERGLTVLTARSAALEEAFGYGIVRQLFESMLLGAPASRRAALLEGPAALAGPVFSLAAAGGASAAPSMPPLRFSTGCTGSRRTWLERLRCSCAWTTPTGPTVLRCVGSPTSRVALRSSRRVSWSPVGWESPRDTTPCSTSSV